MSNGVELLRFESGLIFAVAMFLFGCSVAPGTIAAQKAKKTNVRLVSIIDGDSLVVMEGHQKVMVRLYGIDAPEYDQAGAKQSRSMLESLVTGRDLTMEVVDIDIYGRQVALIETDGILINEALIASGSCWVYDRYCVTDVCTKWKELESRARSESKGFWKTSNPMPPWKWKAYKKKTPRSSAE